MIDINTDLTRGRVFSGVLYANPQTRAASMGGYYGYYHSIRYADGNIIKSSILTPHEWPLVDFLNAGMYGKYGSQLPMRSTRHVEMKTCSAGRVDLRNTIMFACGAAYRYRCKPSYAPPLSLFLKYNGNTLAAMDSELYGAPITEDEYYDSGRPAVHFFKVHRIARDYNKFFILHGTFFFELESGNMETASGKLAYDSDETYGIVFTEPDPTERSSMTAFTEMVDNISEDREVELEILNNSATAMLHMELEWMEREAVRGMQEAVSNAAMGSVT